MARLWSTTRANTYKSLLVSGGAGNDSISLAAEVTVNAILSGGTGNDTLSGGSGADRLYGGTGQNTLSGNAGDDVLVTIGGRNTDTLTGGDGNDSFWTDSNTTEQVTDLTRCRVQRKTVGTHDGHRHPAA